MSWHLPIPDLATVVTIYEFEDKVLENLVYTCALDQFSFAGSSVEQKDIFEALTWIGESVYRSSTTVLLSDVFSSSRTKELNVRYHPLSLTSSPSR